MFQLCRSDQPRPFSEGQLKDNERHKRAWESSVHLKAISRGRRLVNRFYDPKKEHFVAQFLSEHRLGDYPCDEVDVTDENLFPEEAADGSEPAVRMRDGLCLTLAAEIERAYRLSDFRGPAAVVLAGSLLRSEHGSELLELSCTDHSLLSVGFVLAHLEALGYDLIPRVAASIARRAMIVLLTVTETDEPQEDQ